MRKIILVSFSAILFLLGFKAFNFELPAGNHMSSKDTTILEAGESLFNQFCSGCHNFRQDGIGPQLGGLTSKVSNEWIKQFIKDPQKMIKSKDERAERLLKKYKVLMPSFASFTDKELNAVVAFLNTHKPPVQKIEKVNKNNIVNPVPEAIAFSGIVAGLQLVTQIPASIDSGKMPMTRITKLDVEPKTGNLFIVDLRGKLYRLQQNKPTVYMDMAVLKPAFIHRPGLATGFGSFAFHPEFANNGLLYTTHTEPPGAGKADFYYSDSIKVTLQWVLCEWKVDNPAAHTFAGTCRELFRANMVAPNHGVQEITFNPLAKPKEEDYGLLYIGIGDGGSVEQGFPSVVQSPENIWGTIMRIDPAGKNSANGQYGIPPQNPFAVNIKNKKPPEAYAYGFRNPHRITWTTKKQMLACNIGHGNIESVALVRKGHNYGWPVREGRFVINPFGEMNKVYPLPANDSSYHITYPVAQYDHDEGNAISGGFEYTGLDVPQLKGKYLFGDIVSGRLFYINIADIKQGRQALVKEWKVAVKGSLEKLTQLSGSKRVDLHFGRDAQGELYLLTKADGKVYKIVSTGKSIAALP